MKLWIGRKPGDSLSIGYTIVNTIEEANNILKTPFVGNHVVTDISLPADDKALEFLKQFDEKSHLFHVHLRGTASDELSYLVMKNHWDKPAMLRRTAEIIMVLKGNHQLYRVFGKDKVDNASPKELIAMYLSDNCMVPYEYYEKDSAVIDQEVRAAVKDYIAVCDKPQVLLYDYFEAKRMFGWDEISCWISALTMTQVAEGIGHFINGFTYYNTRPYKPENSLNDSTMPSEASQSPVEAF